jgi:hypothetical protein
VVPSSTGATGAKNATISAAVALYGSPRQQTSASVQTDSQSQRHTIRTHHTRPPPPPRTAEPGSFVSQSQAMLPAPAAESSTAWPICHGVTCRACCAVQPLYHDATRARAPVPQGERERGGGGRPLTACTLAPGLSCPAAAAAASV